MNVFKEDTNLLELSLEKINFGNELIEELKNYAQMDGVTKLERKIKRELTFLKKVMKNEPYFI